MVAVIGNWRKILRAKIKQKLNKTENQNKIGRRGGVARKHHHALRRRREMGEDFLVFVPGEKGGKIWEKLTKE